MQQSLLQPMSVKTIQEYEQVMVDGLRHSFPLLNECELREAIQHSITKRISNGKATIKNNYTRQSKDGTVLEVLKYIENLEPIISSSGVLFKKHKEADNPLSRMIMGFINQRAAYKKEMFKYPKGSESFERYNLLQLLEKLNANSTYGVLGFIKPTYYVSINVHFIELLENAKAL
jgi:DNA polymerase elongation subunit (family B)